MTPHPLPILYSFRRCPYAMRARMALQISGSACEIREVVLRAKPDPMLEASPKGTVPVLVLPDRTVIDESLQIMEWALSRSDGGGWLPISDEEREMTRQLVKDCDGPFKHHLDRYKYASRYEAEGADGLEHRQQASFFLDRLEERLNHSGYLLQDRPAFADHAIFPFIRQFAHTDMDWFRQSGRPHLNIWLGKMLELPVFIRIMEKLPPWKAENPPVYRFAD